tara:strand:- start:1252 stop:2415 length:1164 start_codon:yes stop_codon:yes gene_type:complete
MIPYSRQVIDKNDINSVIKALKSDLVTTGPKIAEFENKINKFLGVKYGVAVNSATSALHISCIALGLKKGDWLWTSPISFVASANCGLYCDAKIDFVDIDKKTFNISITELKKKLILAKAEKKLPKIIVPVSFAGQCCDLKEIKKLSKIYNFKILEDSSHALGAKYEGQKVGNGKYTDISVFSFHPVKIITTLEGGIAVTNNKKLAEKLEMLRSHGITRKKKLFKNHNNNEWYYEQQLLGFNYRMNDIEAALGVEQLKKINKFFKKRIWVKKFYDQGLKKLPINLPHIDSNKISSMHLYVITLSDKFSKKNRDNLIKLLRKKGIGVNVHYIPIHLQPYFKDLGFKKGMFPESEKFYDKAISLPIHPKITKKDLLKVTNTIKNLLINE